MSMMMMMMMMMMVVTLTERMARTYFIVFFLFAFVQVIRFDTYMFERFSSPFGSTSQTYGFMHIDASCRGISSLLKSSRYIVISCQVVFPSFVFVIK